MADLHVKYRQQVRHDEGPIAVTMFVEKVRAVDFVVGYEVRPDAASPSDRPAVTATTQLVAFDVDAQRLRRLTTGEREYLESFRRTPSVDA